MVAKKENILFRGNRKYILEKVEYGLKEFFIVYW